MIINGFLSGHSLPFRYLSRLFPRFSCPLFFIVLFGTAGVSVGQTNGEEMIWPIDFGRYVTSSFGEPRVERFHYGIDLRSGGVIGKEVYSVGDGYVSRVSTSTGGYGNALYITLDSGRTAVYAHLSGFIPEIEEGLFKLRCREGRFTVNWWPQPGEIRVTAGQLVAYSGDSGTWGSPHLHFEIRDGDNFPLNPLNEGMVVRDTVAPQMGPVVLIPLDRKSSVNGYPLPQWGSGNGSKEPFHLAGRVGVAVSVSDRVNGTTNILGIYEISLALDEEIIFSKQYDRLSYTFNGDGSLDYLNGEFHGVSGTISALFRHPGNLLPFYEGDGIIEIPPLAPTKTRTLTITARDHAGNTATRTIEVIFGALPRFTSCGVDSNGALRITGEHAPGNLDRVELWQCSGESGWRLSGQVPSGSSRCDVTFPAPRPGTASRIVLVARDSTSSQPACIEYAPNTASGHGDTTLGIETRMLHDRLIIEITSSELLSSIPLIDVTENGAAASSMYCPVPEGETRWIGAFPLEDVGRRDLHITVSASDREGNRLAGEKDVTCTVLDPYANGSISSDDRKMNVYVPPRALYRTVPMSIVTEQARGVRGLRALSDAYRLLIGEEQLRKSVLVNIRIDGEMPEHAGIFYRDEWDGDRSWTYLECERSGQALTADLGAAVCLAVFEDTVPPVVNPSTPAPGESVRTDRPLISLVARDDGAEIEGADSFRMMIDGEPVYPEYDLRRHIASFKPVYGLARGDHTVEVTVTDQVGNTASKSWQFTILP